MNKINYWLITISALICSVFTLTGCSENNKTDSEDLVASRLIYQSKYENGERYYAVSGAKNKDIEDIIIPSYHNNMVVKEIAPSAFEDYKNLKSIYVASTIEVVGRNAFNNARSLRDVTIPPNSEIKEFGLNAFTHTAIKNIFIPSSLQTIGPFCFDSCHNLNSIDLSSCINLFEISGWAFRHCTSLQFVHLSPNLKVVGESCFADTPNCGYVLMYNQVETIGGGFYKGFIIAGQPGTDITVLYYGTREEWETIEFKGYYHYSLWTYSETYKMQTWHFVNEKPVKW